MIIPALVGLGFLITFVALYRDMQAAKAFPRAQGRVRDTQIIDFETRGELKNGRRRGVRTMHRPVVTYEYQVDGKGYVNRRVNFGTDEAGSLGFAQKIVARYPVGKTVEVIYDPKNPQESGLELRSGWIWFALLAAVIAFAWRCLSRASSGHPGPHRMRFPKSQCFALEPQPSACLKRRMIIAVDGPAASGKGRWPGS